MHPATETTNTEPMAGSHGLGLKDMFRKLAVASYGAQLPGQKVIGRPWTADRDFAVLQLLGGGGVAVLVLLHTFGVDQVGDVDQHALGCDLLAADFFLPRIEQLMHLYGEGPRLSLTLAFTRRLDLQL